MPLFFLVNNNDFRRPGIIFRENYITFNQSTPFAFNFTLYIEVRAVIKS